MKHHVLHVDRIEPDAESGGLRVISQTEYGTVVRRVSSVKLWSDRPLVLPMQNPGPLEVFA